MSRSARVAALCVLSWAGTAEAHGPPPFVLGVAAADAEGPRVLVVTEGLVQRRAGAWYFVCPSRFGSDPSPTALSADGERTFVVGDDDLHVLEADGSIEALGLPELRRRFVVSLVEVGSAVHAVWVDETASALRPIDGSAAVWSTSDRVQAASGDADGLWAASATGDMGRVEHVGLSGEPIEERAFPLLPDEAITAVRATRTDVFVALVDLAFHARLLRLGADGSSPTLATASEPFRGLAAVSAGELWTASDGTLYRTQADEAFSVPTGTPTTCVAQLGGATYACAGTRLHALDAEGVGEPLVDLADLEAPVSLPPDPVARERCMLEWATFRDDLEAIGVLAPESEADAGGPDAGRSAPRRSTRSESSGGCSASGSHSRGALAKMTTWVNVAALMLWARRRRRVVRG